MTNKTILIKNEKCWMEQTALTQLENVACLPGVVRAVGLPDLHAGKSPIGIAVETMGVIYPHLIGNDIGCGMGLFKTGISARKYKQDRFVTRLNYIRALGDLPTKNPFLEESPIYDLGTIGSGNHFAEFQKVEEVFDQGMFQSLDLGKEDLLLLVHSGSRGYGQAILQQYLNFAGLSPDSTKGRGYLLAHDDALLWAKRNRQLVAEKLVEWLGFARNLSPVLDCAHNFLQERDEVFIHRKGAVSSENGLVIIPGSRGSLTYLVAPSEDTAYSAYSLSHGAGRKWARSLCKSRIGDKYDRDSIRQTALKSRIVCHDTELLYQEVPEAYKNINHIIDALTTAGLIKVVATMRPLITYKG